MPSVNIRQSWWKIGWCSTGRPFQDDWKMGKCRSDRDMFSESPLWTAEFPAGDEDEASDSWWTGTRWGTHECHIQGFSWISLHCLFLSPLLGTAPHPRPTCAGADARARVHTEIRRVTYRASSLASLGTHPVQARTFPTALTSRRLLGNSTVHRLFTDTCYVVHLGGEETGDRISADGKMECIKGRRPSRPMTVRLLLSLWLTRLERWERNLLV